MAHFTADQADRFFKGERIPCHSSWVVAAQWHPDPGILTIFTSDNAYDSPPISESEAGDFALAESKGAFLNSRSWWNKRSP